MAFNLETTINAVLAQVGAMLPSELEAQMVELYRRFPRVPWRDLFGGNLANVSGTIGTAPPPNVQVVAGVDSTNTVRSLLTDSAGRLVPGTSRKVTYKVVVFSYLANAAVGGTYIVLTLWHSAASTKRVEVKRVSVQTPAQTGQGAGFYNDLIIWRAITTTPTGGVAQAVTPTDPSAPAAEATVLHGFGADAALTNVTLGGSLFARRGNVPATQETALSSDSPNTDGPVVLRAGQAEGLAVQLNPTITLTANHTYGIEIEFTEE